MALVTIEGRRAGALFVAPHAEVPLGDAAGLLVPDPAVQAELAARVADWHDSGSREALAAATARSGFPGVHPTFPRGMIDLNRGWRGRDEAVETLFGKGAVDGWVRQHLAAGAEARLEAWHRAALAGVRAAAAEANVLVELHSYGDLGSTYDRMAGGRPMLRSEAAAVHGAPWATAFPVGLSRLIPAHLRGTPWALESRVGAALAERGLTLGPSPYPALVPWTVSARFLADRWFRWLGRSGRLPADSAARLSDLAWTDEQAEVDGIPGAAEVAATLGEWSHAGAELVRAFQAEDGATTLGMELRIDRIDRAVPFGEAVADAVVGPSAPS